MLQVYTTIINTTITLGKPLHRWISSIVIMIEKENSNSNIHRFRVINKLEADYKLILKFFWPKKATQLVEQRQTLPDNQWREHP